MLTFTVKDSNCSASGGIILTQSFSVPIYIWPVTKIFNDTTICPGDSVSLTAVGGNSFTWTVLPGGSPLNTLSCTNCKNPTAKPTQTTYYVVTSNNLANICNRNKDTVEIKVVTPPQMNLGPDIVTCVNNSYQLNLNLVPPNPSTTYNVKWTPNTFLDNDTIVNPTIVNPTNDITYYVDVKPNGISKCSTKDTINVHVLQGFKVFNGDTAICAGNPVSINAVGDPGYVYTWTPAQGVSNINIINPTINPDTSRQYVVTATHPNCRDSVQKLYIDVQPNPVVFIGANQNLCYGDTIHFDMASVTPDSYPFYDYEWTPSGSFNDYQILHPVYTAYQSAAVTLTATTPAGCVGSATVQVDVYPADFLQLSNDTAICPRDTIQLQTIGTYTSVVWSPNYYISDTSSTAPYVYPTSTVTYTVLARNVDYCLDTQKVTITVYPQPVVSVLDSVRIYPGETYIMNPEGNCLYFSWFPPVGLSNPNIANPVASPEVNTRYFVTGRAESGCVTSDSIDVFVNKETLLDMPNAFTPGSAPNAFLKVSKRGIAELKYFRVYNRWGVKVFETRDLNEGWDGTMNNSPQPMGVYVYTVEAVTNTGKEFTKSGNVTLIR